MSEPETHLSPTGWRHDGPADTCPANDCRKPVADHRTYGQPDGEGWAGSTDPLESVLLDLLNPRSDMRRGARGFQVEDAKRVAAALRTAFADGTLTLADLKVPAGIAEAVKS